ncbi:MAG: hypothetical protein U0X20_28260 [Caldilineaceae bacterium]
MSLTTHQYQSLHLASCDLAEQLPSSQFLASLVAIYEAGRLLHMTKTQLVGLLGSVAVRCVTEEVDEAAPCAPPEPGTWPRIVKQVAYDHQGNLVISGIDDHDQPWQELFGGCAPEAWLIKQLYVERRYGRRSKRYPLKKKPARRPA